LEGWFIVKLRSLDDLQGLLHLVVDNLVDF
jgi:hypothetical protein